MKKKVAVENTNNEITDKAENNGNLENKNLENIKSNPNKINQFIKVVLTLVITFTIVWLIPIFSLYADFYFNHDKNMNFSDKDDYCISAKCPTYPQFTGNYCITKNTSGKASLIIWPSFTHKWEYGILINKGKDAGQYDVDKNMKALNKKDQKILDKYEDEIKILSYKANKEWELK